MTVTYMNPVTITVFKFELHAVNAGHLKLSLQNNRAKRSLKVGFTVFRDYKYNELE